MSANVLVGLGYDAHGLLLGIVSGGFANVHPNNKLTINAVEAAPLENFSIEVCHPRNCLLRSLTNISLL